VALGHHSQGDSLQMLIRRLDAISPRREVSSESDSESFHMSSVCCFKFEVKPTV
jgi:hypothetical protein